MSKHHWIGHSVIAALACAGLSGCDWDWNRERQEPPRAEAAPPGASPANAPQPLASASRGADDGRPSTDENMGRGFQGSIEVSIQRPGAAARQVRYIAQGNDARLQVDGGGQRGLDALIWGENISLIDSAAHTYRTVALDEVASASSEPPVTVQKTGEQRSFSGVFCERYEIDDGPSHVTAWVTALPGRFSPSKFEAVSGIALPGWVKHLLSSDRMPLEAHATERASGRPLYDVTLVRYAGDAVDPSLISIPEGYTRVGGGRAAPGSSR